MARLVAWDAQAEKLAVFGDDRSAARYYDFGKAKWTPDDVTAEKAAIAGQLARARQWLRESRSSYDWDGVQQATETIEFLKATQSVLRPGRPKVPGLFACYLPARVFGPSPKVGLTQRQCHLLSALVGETTRASGKSERPVKALVVRVGADADAPRPSIPLPPGLAAGEYVAFNGSGWGKKIGLRGYGFKLGTWAEKAGFPDTTPAVLLADLRALSGPFGLVVAGWSKDDNVWRGLDDLQALVRTKVGRDWLSGCVLRVYTGAGFLVRWRRYFADRLGFRWLPGGEEEPAPGGTSAGIHSGVELTRWMQTKKYTDKSLAEILGVSRFKVNLVRNGRRKWSPDFDRKLNAILGGR